MLAGRGNLLIVLTDRHVLTCRLSERQVVQTQIDIILQHLTVHCDFEKDASGSTHQRERERKKRFTCTTALTVLASVVLPSALPSAPCEISNLAIIDI